VYGLADVQHHIKALTSVHGQLAVLVSQHLGLSQSAHRLKQNAGFFTGGLIDVVQHFGQPFDNGVRDRIPICNVAAAGGEVIDAVDNEEVGGVEDLARFLGNRVTVLVVDRCPLGEFHLGESGRVDHRVAGTMQQGKGRSTIHHGDHRTARFIAQVDVFQVSLVNV